MLIIFSGLGFFIFISNSITIFEYNLGLILTLF
ncbi:hypothetical protein SAMN05443667_101664 [Flavobacterium gillisiae]|uniref:Uncharacterized protein n=1 Tax=Flavobacterium gillisiae TaxID=150146 RepID=A0A1H3XUH5_9FLAO|nr:hypothetical protein SAMN05443667_101664 [Flavobacterium gillisiae]